MKRLQLLSTTAAILLLGVCTVSAQGVKTNETTGAPPTVQQNAPPERMAPALKSDQGKAPDKIGQDSPTAPKSDKELMTDKGAPAVAKHSSNANTGVVDEKSPRTAHNGHRRHFAGRYEEGRNGPLYDRYAGHRGYYGCRDRYHSWTLGLWC